MGTLAQMPRLRGRQAEVAALAEAVDRAASGQPAIVLIQGEPGIGKTRLLAGALADARGRGMQVAAGRAEELERSRPFGLLAGAFGCTRSAPDPRRAAIAALLSAHGSGDAGPITVTSDPGLQFRAVDEFTDLVEDLALSRPLLIGVDDLHWADPSSLLTLAAIGRRLAYLPVAVIGCFRPSPRIADLERMAAALEAAGARQLTVRGLPEAAVAGLVADAVGTVPGPGLLAGLSGAAGNPLFVTELLAALVQEGAIATDSGLAEVSDLTLPSTLRLTILRRLSFLPEDTLQALRAASILGPGFSLADLASVTGRPAMDLSVVLAEAIRARILEDDDAVLRFRHDLIRECLYADLPASVRQGLHRETGHRLAQAGAPAGQVAEHLARGAGPGDSAAIGWLTRAAREAAARSPDAAADLLERAIGLMDARDPGRDQLIAEQAGSLMLAGRIAAAEAACRSLLDRDHDESAAAAVRICLGHALFAQGQAAGALSELERAAASPAAAGAERAAARAWTSYARLALGDLDGAAGAAGAARSAAAAAGDHLSAGIALASLALVAEFRGELPDALHSINEAVRLADQSPGKMGHRHPLHGIRGWLLMELDRGEEARAALRAGRQLGEELGVRWPLPTYQVFTAYERFIAGDWDDALTELEAGFGLADEIGEVYSRVYADGVLALISFHRNDLGRAADAASAADRDLAGRSPGYRMTLAAWPRALIQEANGDRAAALATLGGAWQACGRLGLVLEYPAVGPDLIRLALAAGDAGLARDVSAAVTGVAAGHDVPWITGAALRCQGLVADDTGKLHAAATACARGSRPLQHALACEDAGAAFARRSLPERARPLLEQALGIYERLQATRDLARAEAVLREAGIRRGRRGPRARPQAGWRSLTPAERAVAGLVAEGLSNPQIGERLYVSRRTVQTHVAHVFAKLDLTSRAHLAAEVTRQLGSEPPVGANPVGA